MKCQQFMDALRALEERGDLDQIVRLFDPSAELWNPELRHTATDSVDPRQFWQTYRDTFLEVHSEFRSAFDSDEMTALEWETAGTLRSGNQPFRYRGASVIQWAGDRIVRFAAYFDPQALRAEHPQQLATPSRREGPGTRQPRRKAA